jgi:WD40 repeat protein
MFSADSKRMVAVGGGKAYVFDVVGQRQLGEPIDGVGDSWLNGDGSILAIKKDELGLTLWRCAGDGSLTKLADVEPDVYINYVVFDHAGDVIAFVSENQVRVWSLRDRRFVGRPVLHDGLIADVEFSADDRWLATASRDKRARIWEVTSGLPASDWFDHDGSATIATFSPGGRQLLTVSFGGNLRIWSLAGTADASDTERRLLARAAEVLSGLQIDPDTAEQVSVPRPFDALEALRGEIERACPAATCTSATVRLIRAVL